MPVITSPPMAGLERKQSPPLPPRRFPLQALLLLPHPQRTPLLGPSVPRPPRLNPFPSSTGARPSAQDRRPPLPVPSASLPVSRQQVRRHPRPRLLASTPCSARPSAFP